MSLEIRIDGVLIEDRVRLTGGSQGGVAGFPAAAWYGQIMTAGLQIDDPSGTLDVHGWHVLTADETACSKPRIFTGWITGTKWSRGPYRTGAGRVIDCDIVDQNSVFGFEVFRSTAASIYPAQTDLQRIEQARSSHAMAGTPIVDNGRVSSDNPVNLTGVNFVGRYPGELFTSTAGESGKQYYAYWDDAAEEISLHYAPLGEGPAASWGVSNVIADVDDDTTFFPMVDGQMARSPDDVNTGLLFGYSGGRWVYARNQELIDELSPTDLSPVNFLRDAVYQTDRVGLTSTANILVQRYLADKAAEDEVITFTVRVPASKVNLAHAGDLIPLRFTHLEGYSTEISRPVVRRNVIPSPGRRDMYDITYECSGEATQVGPGGGTGGETPHQNSCDDTPTVVQSTRASLVSNDGDPAVDVHGASWPAPPTPGNLLICSWTCFAQQTAVIGDMAGWTLIEDEVSFVGVGGSGGMLALYWKIAEDSEPTTPEATGGSLGAPNLVKSQNYLFEVEGVNSFDVVASGFSETQTVDPGVSITPTADNVAFIFTSLLTHQGSSTVESGGVVEDYDDPNLSDAGNPQRWIGHLVVADTTGSYDVNPTLGSAKSWASITAAFYCSGSEIPPPPHIQVPPRAPTGAVDGSNTDFTTDGPFDDASLRVLHDGIDETTSIVTADGEAGTFTLDYAPSAGSVLETYYQSR